MMMMQWQDAPSLLATFSGAVAYGRARATSRRHRDSWMWSHCQPWVVQVGCDNIVRRTRRTPCSFADARLAPGSHEVFVKLLESNDIGWRDGWSGYVLDMPYVPVAAEVNISSNAGLTNLEVVMHRCSAVKTLKGTATATLSGHALSDLDAALTPHLGMLQTIEALHVSRQIAKLLAQADLKNFDWNDAAPSHLDVYFSIPRKIQVVHIFEMPDSSEAWQAFAQNATGLKKFKVPLGASEDDLTFLLNHNIQTLDVSWAGDSGCDFLRSAPKQWKQRIVRLGIDYTQGACLAKMMHDFPHLIQIVFNAVDDDHPEGGGVELVPDVLRNLCRQRSIELTDESSEHRYWDFYDSSGPEHY